MDNKKILSSKLTFIKSYLGGVKDRCLSLPFDWFYVSTPLSDKDMYGYQSFRIVDLFREYKDDIMKELKEVNISVETYQKMHIFKMC